MTVAVRVPVRVAGHRAVGPDVLVFVLVLVARVTVRVARVIVSVAVRHHPPRRVGVTVRARVLVLVRVIVRVAVPVRRAVGHHVFVFMFVGMPVIAVRHVVLPEREGGRL